MKLQVKTIQRLSIWFPLFALAFFFVGCKQKNSTVYLPDSSGPMNTITVITTDSLWENQFGKVLHDEKLLGKSFSGLIRKEPRFSVRQFSPKAFESFKATRNVVIFKSGDSLTEFKTNPFAIPQTVVEVSGKHMGQILRQVEFHSDSMMQVFAQNDYDFLLPRLLRKKSNEVSKVEEKLGLKKVNLTSNYQLIKESDDFFWFRKDIREDILNVTYYTFPFSKDSLSKEFLIQKRDEVLKKETLDDRGAFVKTEERIVADLNKVSDKEFVLRGFWSLEGAQMGGPFLTKFLVDKQKNVVYAADAFIFAPHKQNRMNKKRDYLLEIEALFSTLILK